MPARHHDHLPSGVRDDPQNLQTPCGLLGPTGMVGGVETSCHTRLPSLINYAAACRQQRLQAATCSLALSLIHSLTLMKQTRHISNQTCISLPRQDTDTNMIQHHPSNQHQALSQANDSLTCIRLTQKNTP
jgi:hypothetical protein